MNYRREIDGLRALAVLPVILFHAGFQTFSGGFIGVDVFFVISGYLITTIILAELEQGKFSIVDFYERRARRILPVLFLVMLVCIPFSWFLLLPEDMRDFLKSLVAVSIFVSNFLFWRESGYFSSTSELKPLLHTWSLGVEEQFYVFFPLFFLIFWKIGKRTVLFTLGLVFVASLGLAEWASYLKPSSAFYLLPTRVWELLIGALAAFFLFQADRKYFRLGLSEVAGWAGVILILYSIFFYNKNTPFPGFYALVPTLGTLLIIVFATQQTNVGKFVGNKIFVGVGLISYSAYLWHQPLFAFARHLGLSESNNIIFLVLCLITFLLAYLSWRFVELPFRRKNLIPKKWIIKLSLFFTIFFVSLGSYGVYKDGFGYRFPVYINVLSSLKWPEKNNITADCKSKFGGDQYCLITDSKVAPSDILIGDSHANHFFFGLSRKLKEANRNLLMFGAGGCPPLIDIDMGFHYLLGVKLRCYERTSEKLKSLLLSDSVRNVFLSFSGNGYFDTKIELFDLKGEIDFKTDRGSALTKGFMRTINLAQNSGKRVYIIEDLPNISFGKFQKCLAQTNDLSMSLQCLNIQSQPAEYFEMLETLQSQGARIIRTKYLLNTFPFTDKGEFLYRDGTHLSLFGSLYFGDNVKLFDLNY